LHNNSLGPIKPPTQRERGGGRAQLEKRGGGEERMEAKNLCLQIKHFLPMSKKVKVKLPL
jgi:hypothetical protein